MFVIMSCLVGAVLVVFLTSIGLVFALGFQFIISKYEACKLFVRSFDTRLQVYTGVGYRAFVLFVMKCPPVLKSALVINTTYQVYASSIVLARSTQALIFVDVAILSAPPWVTRAAVASSLDSRMG